MRYILRQIYLPLDYDDAAVRAAAVRHMRCRGQDLRSVRIVRRSLDARYNRKPRFVVSVEAELARPLPSSVLRKGRVEAASQPHDTPAGGEAGDGGAVERTSPPSPEQGRADGPPGAVGAAGAIGRRVVVVGAGPAGLMAALVLAEAGARPILLERGRPAGQRGRDVHTFWKTGQLDLESNALYGEGGAGLFSDGKLTSRSKDRRRVRQFLQTLVDCGAGESILIDAEPHLGSDAMARIVPALRERIIRAGGEVRFGARVDALVVDGGAVRGVEVAGETIAADACILATGHSAREVYAMVHTVGGAVEAKPTAVGVRLEMPQAQIDQSQFGRWAGHPRLGAASLRLSRRGESGGRDCYSFCACPGGLVIACASEAGGLSTNGMSYSARGGMLGNAALLVPVGPEDYRSICPAGGGEALAGCGYLRSVEQRAYTAGGEDFSLPACRLTDFLAERVGELPQPRSVLRARPAEFRDILPEPVWGTLFSSILKILSALRNVAPEEVLLYAAETRTSSPVRMVRDEVGASVGLMGLYPAGEGAGYAGGIVSSAVDGMRAAEGVLRAPRT